LYKAVKNFCNGVSILKPLLKWAGSKRQIIKHIAQMLPSGSRLIEPFVGSGAVFLNTDFPSYLISDSNNDLIQLYKLIKSNGTDFIDYCQSYFSKSNNTEKKYYKYRDLFNTSDDIYLKSALFLYLNRHGYNGLCRYRMDGTYNVPYGYYKAPYFPRKEMHFFYERSQLAQIKCSDYKKILKKKEILCTVIRRMCH